MGPFTLFRMTWGLPKPVMGMSLSSCPERLPSLAVIFTHFHPRSPFARHYWLQLWFSGEICGEFNEWRVQGNDGKKERKESGTQGAINVIWKWVKTPRCEDSKVSNPTKQQVHTNYAMWPRGSCSLWVLWRKEASVALHKHWTQQGENAPPASLQKKTLTKPPKLPKHTHTTDEFRLYFSFFFPTY